MTAAIPHPPVFDPTGPLGAALADIGLALMFSAAAVFGVVIWLLIVAIRGGSDAGVRGGSDAGAGGGADAGNGSDADAAGHRRFAWRWIVGGGVAFPLVVLSLWLLMSTAHVSGFVADGRRIVSDPKTLVISIDARMWWWRIRYAAADGRDAVVTANELRLPAGRPIRLALTSDDVIHSFWVPALAGKVDMVPGRIHHLELDGLLPGTHRGQCAEFCGEQHARMALHVVVEPGDDFDRWLAHQQRPAPAPNDEAGSRGLMVFRESRCEACHAIRGATGAADGGPDLTHVGSRLFIGAGTLVNDRQRMEQWLVDLQRIKSGARMPSYERLDGDDRAALARYLGSLQ